MIDDVLAGRRSWHVEACDVLDAPMFNGVQEAGG